MAGIFISATGTAIGKTYLVERLLHWDKAQAACLSASKPVISGWPDNDKDIQHTDTGLLLAAQQLSCTKDNLERCSPWRYRPPLTPSMAAKLTGQPPLPMEDLVTHCHQLMQKAKDAGHIHLIEGVGGVMAPLAKRYTVLDWIAQLGCPCLLIGGSYLGTLSHILTAMVALQSMHIPILGVVVNETPRSSVPLEETTQALRELLSPLPILTIAFAPKRDDTPDGLDQLYALIMNKIAFKV